MKTFLLSASSNPRAGQYQPRREKTPGARAVLARAAEAAQPSLALDLVSQVLERALVLGWASLVFSKSASTLAPRRVGVKPARCAEVSTAKKRRAIRFVPCVEPQPLLKQIQAVTGFEYSDDCFVSAAHRMNNLNFGRREILEEISPRSTIHPSTERTVSSHE